MNKPKVYTPQEIIREVGPIMSATDTLLVAFGNDQTAYTFKAHMWGWTLTHEAHINVRGCEYRNTPLAVCVDIARQLIQTVEDFHEREDDSDTRAD